MELSEIAELTVKERLQTIPNVSGVDIWGQKRYSMRLWLDPIKMAGYGITPLDVKNAVDAENVELPSGSIEGNTIDLSIRTLGLMHTATEFNDLIIKRDGDNIIRFQDVGRAEVSPEDLRSVMRKNGEPMVIDVIIPQPGANQIEIADEAYKRIEQLKKDLPEDVTVEMVYDNTRFIRASIAEVEETIYVAFLLVVLIIFLFLRDWRVTLVPVVVIPVSLVGAFFVMYVSGFSINVLTMLAVVLSVGLVVDDAIVMAENIYVRIEQGMEPKEAGIDGAKEIFFAVVSTTVTLVSVFLPIVFMEGMTGRLFKEFSIVIAGSVTISSFVALTFTPMLATKLLRKRENKGWLYTKTEPFFEGMNNIYAKSLNAFLNHKWWSIPIVVILFGSIGYFWRTIRSELSPLEDRSSISINIRAQEGATFEFIRDFTDQVAAMADTLAPERQALTVRANNSNGYITVLLPDIKDRERSQMEIADVLSKNVRGKTEARAFVQQQSTFGGRRAGMRSICFTSDQPGEATGVFARLYAEGKRKPGVPDGRREPEVYETRSPYRDQPRQSFFIGRQHPHDCPDTTICIERPAYGIFLHERETVSDIGRNQPPAAQHAVGPEIHLCPQRCRRDDPTGQPRHVERRRCPSSAVPLQPLCVGNGFQRTQQRLYDR